MWKLDERVAMSEERARDEIKSVREKREINSPQQQQCDPSKAKDEPKLVDLHGVGREGAGEQQFLQKQQLPQSPACRESSSQRIAEPATKKRCRPNNAAARCARYLGRRRCGAAATTGPTAPLATEAAAVRGLLHLARR